MHLCAGLLASLGPVPRATWVHVSEALLVGCRTRVSGTRARFGASTASRRRRRSRQEVETALVPSGGRRTWHTARLVHLASRPSAPEHAPLVGL